MYLAKCVSFGATCILSHTGKYNSPSLIRPPYLPRNCVHIREVAFGEREKLNTLTVVVAKIYGLIREGGLC